ncbi:MAG: 2-amino-4-hydroxy-6-hydroxymethyldihydropteridine diphosphokinase [Dokdonella sp.]
MTRAYVGLGSNLDAPEQQIERALDALATRVPQTQLLRTSRRYRTLPWGIAEQPAFVNAVAEVATSLPPRDLLEALLMLERVQGRHRDGARWGPRTIDLDLLVYGDLRAEWPGLMLPHPRLAERAFVLVPLADLDADLVIPGVGAVRDLLAGIDLSDCVPLA